jgi:hypothetical protein
MPFGRHAFCCLTQQRRWPNPLRRCSVRASRFRARPMSRRKLVVQAAERSATGRRRRLTLETAGGM